jgi:hypothetical protein
VVHEWGTFTSLQVFNGEQLVWNPLIAPDLPKFVYDANVLTDAKGVPIPRPAFKSNIASRQRMETPVVYFYSDKPLTVDVEVKFPGGEMTEWYPKISSPIAEALNSRPIAEGNQEVQTRLHWAGVQLRPGADESSRYPQDGAGSHYYAARATASSPLRVKTVGGTEQDEKFLFYRGVARFHTPLRVLKYGSDNAEQLTLVNDAKEPLKALFVYAVRGERAALVAAPALPSGERSEVSFNFDQLARLVAEVRAELAIKLQKALIADGLFEKEAAAMIETWSDAWFAEQGTRVLYTLPEAWTNGILPLTVTPTPKQMRRVFVGRAELLTPATEWTVLREMIRHAEGDDAAKSAAVKAVQALSLGRFTSPILDHVTGRAPQVGALRTARQPLQEAAMPKPQRPVALVK